MWFTRSRRHRKFELNSMQIIKKYTCRARVAAVTSWTAFVVNSKAVPTLNTVT